MIRIAALIAAAMTVLLLWHECGEDVAVFCYRISVGAFTALRSRPAVPALVPVPANHLQRTRAACSNSSNISSTRCIAPKDFAN
jgi:hypothetical protein